jgi:hypothetical protein
VLNPTILEPEVTFKERGLKILFGFPFNQGNEVFSYLRIELIIPNAWIPVFTGMVVGKRRRWGRLLSYTRNNVREIDPSY